MNADLNHLHPDYQQFALLDDSSRIDWLLSDRYLAYRRADRALKRLEDLFRYPTRDRMPCLLLYGEPGVGKTKILKKFLRDHPPIINDGTGNTSMPVVFFQMPPEPNEADFYLEMLKAMGGAFSAVAHAQNLQMLARRLLVDMGVRMLMIDEVHAMLAGTSRQQRLFLNTIRFLTNDLRIPIVCAGIEDARVALLADQQLADRFEALQLTRGRNDGELSDLLAGFSAILPLRRPSALNTPAARKKLLDMTDGVTVRLFRLIETLAIEAINSGRECLDQASFSQEDLVLPLVSMMAARRVSRG